VSLPQPSDAPCETPRSREGKWVSGFRRNRAPTKRELISPKGDKRLIRRDEKGRIKESDDLGNSLSTDVRKHVKTVVG
jgi:hypothetical protein